MIVAIHQPNYLPWLGYFNKIASADIFVFLDDVQFSKGSYTNRVQILSPAGAKWLTVPVKLSFGDDICDTGFASENWRVAHVDTLRAMYRAAPFFKGVWPDVREMILSAPGNDLAAVNINLVIGLAQRLGLCCEFMRSSSIKWSSVSDDRLVEIASAVAPGGTYLSGKGGAKYQDPGKFRDAGLGFAYANFQHPVYEQIPHPGLSGFVPGLSVLDSVFHVGWARTAAMIRNADT